LLSGNLSGRTIWHISVFFVCMAGPHGISVGKVVKISVFFVCHRVCSLIYFAFAHLNVVFRN
jgi:hypothetical protein